MRYGLIGCGRIAVNHIKAALSNGLEIIAVCDITESQARKLLDGSEIKVKNKMNIYTDYKEMLSKHQFDLISIATESGSHAEIALYCIKRKIPVIIEKPIALSMEDANEIVRLSEKLNVVVGACHQNRFNIAVQKMRNAIDQGRFGAFSHGAVHIRWNRDKSYYSQASWRGTWAQDGGALMNQCIHGIDLLRWSLGGEIIEVYGTIRQQFHSYLEAEDVGLAILKFKNGAIATIEGTTNVFPQNLEETLYLFGEKGTVKLGGKSTNNIDIWDFADETKEDQKNKDMKETVRNVYGNGHISLFADVMESIKKNRKPYVDARAGKDALETVLAIYKSQKEGRPVKLPLTAFSSTDMKGEVIHSCLS